MNNIYSSNKPLTRFSGEDCPIANQTVLTIYKEQLRTQAGRDLNLLSYISELHKSYKRLESSYDNHQQMQWINLESNYLLIVSTSETRLFAFDDRLELFEYLEKKWTNRGYLFIDFRTHIIDYSELKEQLEKLTNIISDRIEEGVTDYLEGGCEYDRSDEYREYNCC
jgi:hypothetical protein